MISAIISRIVILLFGKLYPAYASYKAVRTKNVKEYVKWMMYWIVFAFFSFFETITDIFLSWFPFYYEVKVILVLWLLSPATKGSSTLYRKFVHPMLTRREQDIDEYISQAKEKGYTAVLQLGSKGVNYATNVIMQTAIKTLTLSNGSGTGIKTSQSDNSLQSSVQTATLTEIYESSTGTDTTDYIRMQRSTSVDSALSKKRNGSIGSYNLRSHDVILEGSSDDEDNILLSQLVHNDNGAARSREILPTKTGKHINTTTVKVNSKTTGIKGRRRLKQEILEMDLDVDVD